MTFTSGTINHGLLSGCMPGDLIWSKDSTNISIYGCSIIDSYLKNFLHWLIYKPFEKWLDSNTFSFVNWLIPLLGSVRDVALSIISHKQTWSIQICSYCLFNFSLVVLRDQPFTKILPMPPVQSNSWLCMWI